LTQTAADGADEAARVKLAEGKYAVTNEADLGAVGPFPEQVYGFHETWTIWRTGSDSYEVDGKWRFESPKDVIHDDRFLVHLSRDFTVIDVTEFTKLTWVRDSGPLSCRFQPLEMDCSSGGTDPKRSLKVDTPMHHPFGILWPISAFSLSGITREAERNSGPGAEAELASIEQPSQEDPVDVTILEGRLRYLGEEQITLAGQNWRAHKFSLQAALEPEFLIWVSPRGLLLAATAQHRKNRAAERMELVQFRKWDDF
jgi:hypothetical protein